MRNAINELNMAKPKTSRVKNQQGREIRNEEITGNLRGKI